MANEKTNLSDTVAQIVTRNNATPSSSQDAVNELLARKLRKEILAEEERENQAKAAQRAGAESMMEMRRRQEADQAACPHLKPRNGGSALAGQRLHGGKGIALICQYCGKEFRMPTDDPKLAVPKHLMPDTSFIGGPNH